MSLKKWLLLPVVLFLAACDLNDVVITEQKLNTYLKERVTLDKEIGVPGIFSAHIKLDQITAQIGRVEADKVDISAAGVIDMTSNSKKDQIKLNVQLRARPDYQKGSGELYLRDLDILSLTTDPAEHGQALTPLLPIISRTIGQLLLSKPVYRFDAQGNVPEMVKDKVSGLAIKPGEIVVPVDVI